MPNKEEFIHACESSASMSEACAKLKIPYTTFKRVAQSYGVYKPSKDTRAHKHGGGVPSKLSVEGLNNGEFPNFQSYKLKRWLWKNHIKENRCEICGITEWNGKSIECALHHKDGNKHNNKLENLEILCPNCHSQTDNFTSKNRGRYK